MFGLLRFILNLIGVKNARDRRKEIIRDRQHDLLAHREMANLQRGGSQLERELQEAEEESGQRR